MIKFLNETLLTNKQFRFFIFFVICINAIGLFSPVLGSNDSNFYAVVAKHIILNHDWVNLTFNNQDWLDKPHLPFWIVAISYKVFGINPFAYIFPGFVFNIIGGYYTYLLARHLFGSKEVGLISALIYFSSVHLMLSSIDVRQEAYLLGEIIPACYYWYRYNEATHIHKKYLIYGAIFTAMAVMTKGIFVLFTIFSGLIAVWLINNNLRNFISRKWLLAVGLSFILIMPELLVLYLQFDAHPEKIVFGQHNVSGILWFFWGSQFGRFFDIGAITSGKSGHFAHYFFFIHTFLWSFLPWSLVALFAIWSHLKPARRTKDVPENINNKRNRTNYIYLLASFLPTFILFSLTNFQLDHYTNILIPFAAILCADFLFNRIAKLTKHPLVTLQIIVAYALCLLVLVLALFILSGKSFILLLVSSIIVIILFVILVHNYPLTKAILYPILSICLIFELVATINAQLYSKYDIGYQIANYIPIASYSIPLVDYNVNSSSLEFFTHNPYLRIDSIDKLLNQSRPFYLAISDTNWQTIRPTPDLVKASLLNKFLWIGQEKFIATLLNKSNRQKYTQNILLYLVN